VDLVDLLQLLLTVVELRRTAAAAAVVDTVVEVTAIPADQAASPAGGKFLHQWPLSTLISGFEIKASWVTSRHFDSVLVTNLATFR